MTTELNMDEYENTLTERMVNVTGIEMPPVDIWPYVQELVSAKIIAEKVYNEQLVEIAYRNESSTYDHVLLPTANRDIFIVIVIDLVNALIKGHYRQDLNEVYGLT